ncbi:hypothetical protein [Paracoccus alkanivorans]|uniref:Uncharacterized protein n=1 Tax=Paracoccus alkanivorans TaxID=2116655 RepID=A0A3M0MIU4_9RHOB|nr:hypothetical protein [Paracoccus alkanivorans]RMC37521.1 hypothetical protein C9E81_01850 [Paracoccus alkanivorans]
MSVRTFTREQLRGAYAFQVRQGYTGDMGRTAAAMKLLGSDATDDQIEQLATEIGRAVEAEGNQA